MPNTFWRYAGAPLKCKKPGLRIGNIVASIRRLVLDFTERSGIKGQLKAVGEERRLPLDTEIGLFRIAQSDELFNGLHAGF